jgi:hypothetical protein
MDAISGGYELIAPIFWQLPAVHYSLSICPPHMTMAENIWQMQKLDKNILRARIWFSKLDIILLPIQRVIST